MKISIYSPQEERLELPPPRVRGFAARLSHALRSLWRGLPVSAVTIAVPVLAAAIYYYGFAAEMYVSEMRYAVVGKSEIPADSLGALIPGVSRGAGLLDAYIVRDYLLSQDAVDALQQELDLRSHYTNLEADLLSRLDSNSSREQFLEYYKNVVLVELNTTTLITTVEVRAFDAEYSAKLAASVLRLGESFVNTLSDRVNEDFIRFSVMEVERAESRLGAARRALTTFRIERDFDPAHNSEMLLSIISTLEGALTQVRAEITELESYTVPNSSSLRSLRAREAAIANQIVTERKRLAGSKGGLADVLSDYDELLSERDFAQRDYEAALGASEAARAAATQQQKYLVTVVKPTVPETATFPDRPWILLSVFLISSLMTGICLLVYHGLRDTFSR